eukprot:TRINITY_DN6506_c0_g3_i1.p1 TRINITY_DN6506_c0_g3~~TRINITY_DN6506_c0_g3_i1.p1  ORF type:complete len:227 (-),score=22.88 TRINITY_DN6506_c0_g3_i1:349-954(-)
MKIILIAALITETYSVCLVAPEMAPAAVPAVASTAAAGTAAGTAAAGTAAAAAGTAVAGTAGSAATAGTVAKVAAINGIGLLVANPIASYVKLAKFVLSMGVVVGAEADGSAVTWDCWKPILHETSTAPSRGRLLVDILNDPLINDYNIGNHSVHVRNRWNESWRIDPVVLPWGQVAAHASRMLSGPSTTAAIVGGAIGGL